MAGEGNKAPGDAVVVGGASGIGRAVGEALAERGEHVIIAGRSLERAEGTAAEIGQDSRGLELDLTRPEALVGAVSAIDKVSVLVLTAAEANENTASEFDAASAARIAAIKLTGYTAVISALASRLGPDSSILMFGGNAKDRPYPGSTTLTTINGGLATLVRALAIELAPVRVNAIHPGVVADSPAWRDAPAAVLSEMVAGTPTKRLASVQDVVNASLFALFNPSLNGENINLDGGASIL
jgi:NAD(P)-dependent dehydrogenase (short-subunit alcohol dehydrogenase family)